MYTEHLFYTNDKKQKIACDFHYPDSYDGKQKLPTVMIGHGFGGSKESPYILESLPRITEAGLIGVSYNLRGAHQEHPNTRDLTPKNMISDLKHVSKFIAAHKAVDEKNIIAINASYTSSGILEVAIQPDSVKFKGIIAHSTVVHPLDAFKKRLEAYRGLYRRAWSIWGQYPLKINGKKCQMPYGIYTHFSARNLLTDVAPLVDVPVILIQGTKDNLCPIGDVRDLAAALTKSPHVELHEIENAPHDMRDQHLDKAIQFSHQAVDMFLGRGKIVDVNGQPYQSSADNNNLQQMKVA